MASPAELGAEDLVIVVTPRMEQARGVRCALHVHAGVGHEGEIGLTVAGDVRVSLS